MINKKGRVIANFEQQDHFWTSTGFRKPRKVRADDLVAVQDFCGAIDEAAGSVFNDVLNKVIRLFTASPSVLFGSN